MPATTGTWARRGRETDRVYAEPRGYPPHRTQVALAHQMGVPQTVASRLKHQHDMLLSTLTGYLQPAGERPRVTSRSTAWTSNSTWPHWSKDGW